MDEGRLVWVKERTRERNDIFHTRAHKYYLAVGLGVTPAAMLIRPLDWEVRALVVVQLLVLAELCNLRHAIFILNGLVTDGPWASVATLGVVLAVKEPVSVVAVDVSFAVAVVRTAGVVLLTAKKEKIQVSRMRRHI